MAKTTGPGGVVWGWPEGTDHWGTENDGNLQILDAIAEREERAVYTDFSRKANMSPVPATHDRMRIPLSTFYPSQHGAVPLIVNSGLLQTLSVNPASLTVAYTETDLGGDATKIGAEIGFFGPNASGGVCALVCWSEPLEPAYTGSGPLTSTPYIPRTGAHIVFQNGTVGYDIWDLTPGGPNPTGPVTLFSDTFPSVALNTKFRVEVTFCDDSATITVWPRSNVQGETGFVYRRTISDSRIKTLGRRYACWETYQTAGASKPAFGAIWAEARGESATAGGEAPWRATAIMSDETTPFNVTTTPAPINFDISRIVVVPQNGQMLLEYDATFDAAADTTLVISFRVSNAATGGDGDYFPCAIPVKAGRQKIRASAVTSLAAEAGLPKWVVPWAYTTASSGNIIRSVSEGRRPVLIVQSLDTGYIA